MEVKNHSEQQKPISVLEGDGFNFSRILSRESSVGQSSRIYYTSAEGGVPFQWEMQPGTAKNPPQEDIIPPPSPSPLMQSLVLPKPCVDQQQHHNGSKVWFRKKIKKIQQNSIFQTSWMRNNKNQIGTNQHVQSLHFGDHSDGEFTASFNHSSLSSSSSSSSSSNGGQVLDSSRFQRDSTDGHFSCSPWNITSILDEDDTKTHNPSGARKQNKTAFAREDDHNSFLKKILSRVSFADQTSTYRTFEGIPFQWEMHPGTPKNPPEDKHIPPPSPPPSMQNVTLPRPYNGVKQNGPPWSRFMFWMKSKKLQQQNDQKVAEISFRFDDEHSCSFSNSASLSSSSNGSSWLSKLRRGPLDGSFCYSFRNGRAHLLQPPRKPKLPLTCRAQ